MTAKPFKAVIAGLDPAIPIMWHGCASLSGMAGTSSAMTILNERSAGPLRRIP
jgi:hypothetical protein